jgi:hypothetical protein
VNIPKQINTLYCAPCDGRGIAVWLLHIRPRRLRDLVEFSAGFLCVDGGNGAEPFFICAACRLPVLEREPSRPVSEAVEKLAMDKGDILGRGLDGT